MNRPALVMFALLLSHPGTAGAEAGPTTASESPPGATPSAAGASTEQRYAEAQAHFMAARYTEALPIFRALYAESGSPNATLYVARCLREMGQLPEAYEQMAQTEQVASARARTEERFAATSETARQELAALESRIGKLSLSLPTRPPGLEVEVNGKPIASERWGAPIAVMPGQVRIWATAPGHATVRQELAIAAGSAVTIPVRMIPAGGGPDSSRAAVPPTASSPAPEGDAQAAQAPGASGLLTAGIVMVGVGALGFGTFAVAGILANERFADVEEECGGVRCPDPSHDDDIETGRTLDTVANVGLVVGLVGLVTGGVLVAVDLASGEPAAGANGSNQSHALSVQGLPGGGVLGYRQRF